MRVWSGMELLAWDVVFPMAKPSLTRCVAVCCSVLLCFAECYSVLQYVAVFELCVCGGLRWVTVCCSVLQCFVLCCSMLQYSAVCCSILQCTAVQGDVFPTGTGHLSVCV